MRTSQRRLRGLYEPHVRHSAEPRRALKRKQAQTPPISTKYSQHDCHLQDASQERRRLQVPLHDASRERCRLQVPLSGASQQRSQRCRLQVPLHDASQKRCRLQVPLHDACRKRWLRVPHSTLLAALHPRCGWVSPPSLSRSTFLWACPGKTMTNATILWSASLSGRPSPPLDAQCTTTTARRLPRMWRKAERI